MLFFPAAKASLPASSAVAFNSRFVIVVVFVGDFSPLVD